MRLCTGNFNFTILPDRGRGMLFIFQTFYGGNNSKAFGNVRRSTPDGPGPAPGPYLRRLSSFPEKTKKDLQSQHDR